jgi:hypothetical protein
MMPSLAQQIIDKLGPCMPVEGPFNADMGDPTAIHICQQGSVLWWKADMDVDCDGIQTFPCNTDKMGQPRTSMVNIAPNGDLDPTKLPYFVIPLINDMTWYTDFDIQLGQVGAAIYKGQIVFGIFADESGGNLIGEASYNMCSLFIGADNCDPNTGGIDPLDVYYVTFTGAQNLAQGDDIYSHDKHTAMGTAAAKAWLASP